MEAIAQFLDSTGGLAVKCALTAAFLDFAFGVYAAFRDGSFALDSVAAFVRKHLLGRVFPASTLAIVAYYTGDAVMIAAAAGALTAYGAETLASVYASLTKVSNPVPQE